MRSNILMVLNTLERHSDSEHPLSVNGIRRLIEKDFKRSVSAKTVVRILTDELTDNDAFPLREYFDVRKDDEKLKQLLEKKKIPKAESDYILYDADIWHINRIFDDAEIQLLIDLLLSFKYMPSSQCTGIIKKLVGLSSKHFKLRHDSPFNASENNHRLLLTIEDIRQAIERKQRLTFSFLTYGSDKKLHTANNEDGTELEYSMFRPYEIVIKNEKYYLVGAFDSDKLYHFRLDLMQNVRVLEEKYDESTNNIEPQKTSRPMEDILSLGCELDMSKYLEERVFMFSGESETVVLRADKKTNLNIVGHILDWLGKDVEFCDETADAITASAKTNHKAMHFWALQYGDSVEILEPLKLREEVRETVRKMHERYER